MYDDILRTIIKDTNTISDIMLDLLVELPELFKVSDYETVKTLVVDFVCNPRTIYSNGQPSRIFVKVIRRNLPKGTKSESSRLAESLRTKARNAVKGSASDEFLFILGCSIEELREYVEVQFSEGMNWDNYGVDGWHIDHIAPLCSFNLTDPEEVKLASYFKNLRPLWARDNSAKSKHDKKLSIRKKRKT